MTSNPEKSLFLSRLFPCLILVSIVFLILPSSLLFQFGDKLILVNNTSSRNVKLIEFDSKSEAPTFTPPAKSCDDSCVKSKLIEPEMVTSCDPARALLKVFMYDLPPEFHFGLLGWSGKPNQKWPKVSNFSEIPSYPGGLNLQHSPEYWLTLDLLSSLTPNVARPCTAILMQNSSQADIVFVPFLSSLSYNRHSRVHGKEKSSLDKVLQERLVEYLKGTSEWKRFGGNDHLIMAHHPNSMLVARKHLGSAMLVLADFGRYPSWIANLGKDVIAPYKHLVRSVNTSNSRPFEERPTLVYFQGAIYRKDGGWIRQKLYYLIKDEKDVHFTFGNVVGGGIRKASQGMASSKFCLNIAGDTPSSNRLFDAIASHCIPVIISDQIELPFEDVLDYSKFSVFIRASDAIQRGYLLSVLRGVRREKWTEMWENLKQITRYFEYQYPSRPGDAVDMIWQAVFRKVSNVHNEFNRQNRYRMSQNFLKAPIH